MAANGGGGISTSSSGRGSNISVTNINCDNTLSSSLNCLNEMSTDSNMSGTMTSTTIQSAASSNGNNFYGNSDLIQTSGINSGNSNSSNSNIGGIRITVPKMEESDESDTELTNIEKSVINNNNNNTNINKTIQRPMSWEGELSENEDMMEIENTQLSSASVTTVVPPTEDTITHEKAITRYLKHTKIINNEPIVSIQQNNGKQLLNEIIKPEYHTNDTQGAIVSSTHQSLYTSAVQSTNSHQLTFNNKKYHTDLINLKYEPGLQPQQTSDATTNIHSPLLVRSKSNLLPANPSPDSAIHSVYTHSSPSQSPLTSRHAPYTPSLSRNNSDASHSSCYSYSSEFSPTHSPIQGRHIYGSSTYNGSPLHHSVLFRPMVDSNDPALMRVQNSHLTTEDGTIIENEAIPSAGISRQQLINSPCPICGDKISGFHYGIFSCESCKGFFKRTVQNRKNYVCLRGAVCPVTISTRKKCPACRFEKCLQRGMKLEAIREDRTRGGRSTYQCSYTLPGSMLSPNINLEQHNMNQRLQQNGPMLKVESQDNSNSCSSSGTITRPGIPSLLQEIMDVEHLWQYNEAELSRLNQPASLSANQQQSASNSSSVTNPLLANAGLNDTSNPDLIANLCNIADHRLYKIVKWCKSLPLFKNISIDDQICLLINSWCELLLFSCCFRSISSPGEIRISLGKSITLAQSKTSGLQACIERMLNLTDHLRRLRVDKYEYVAMKVIVLLQSDTSELKEPEKVRASQEKALQALQAYTLAHYPETPAKFGELLLRIPELQRTCQVGKEMLIIKSKDGEEFNLLMELLRGEH